ncbi:hypothetical protein JYU34_002290 [Plutella xylostella]|uniref:Arrestin C-terminal-like domain-containing protein n=1 Tax=Plutella xylostella TaxID=51655 RepID=A0ABQ7R1T1_PLUXY|nr:hypothetical protein JYU34_002290 [Plutella xylostella]
MGVMCNILVNRTPRDFYTPGEPVTGIVKYAVDEETKFEDIVLSYVGKGHCSWSENTGTGKHRRTRHYSGTEEIFRINLSILPKDKAQDNTVALPTGAYEAPFQFITPHHIPPTYKDHTGEISYKLKVKFKRPGLFETNKKFYTSVDIKSQANPVVPQEPLVYGIDKTLVTMFSSKKNRINVQAEIQKSYLRAGDRAELRLVVTNDSRVTIPRVQAGIYEKRTYTASCGKTKRIYKYIKASKTRSPTIPDRSVSNFTLSVPSTANLFTIQNCRVVAKEYFVKVTLKLPMPYINASVEIPVVISGAELVEVNELTVSMPSTSAGPSTEAPPTYEEAMHDTVPTYKKMPL